MKSRIVLVALMSVVLIMVIIFFWPKHRNPTLRLIGEALPPLEALAAMAPAFKAETGVEVIVEQYAAEEVHQKVLSDLAGGSATYDIVLQPHKHLGRLVSRGYLQSLGRYGEPVNLGNRMRLDPYGALFPEWWREIGCYDGKIYGFPFSALTMYMWYRKDIFEDPAEKKAFQVKYGYPLQVPEYWDQYRDVAEFFTRPNSNFYGTTIQGKRHDALWYEFLNFLYSFDGNILDAKHGWEYGDVVINSPQAVRALEFYKSLLSFSPSGALNYTWDDALALMQQGRVAMVIMWNDSTYAVDYSEDSTVKGKMGFAMVPKSRDVNKRVGQLEGWAYLIPRSSKNPTRAREFIAWMMQPDRQVEQHLNGGASALLATYQDPKVLALTYTKASLDTMAVAIPKPTIPEGPEMTEILTRELSLALSNQKSPKAALDQAAVEMARLLSGRARLRFPVEE